MQTWPTPKPGKHPSSPAGGHSLAQGHGSNYGGAARNPGLGSKFGVFGTSAKPTRPCETRENHAIAPFSALANSAQPFFVPRCLLKLSLFTTHHAHQVPTICQAHPVEELTIEDFFQDRTVDTFTAPRAGPTVDLFTKIVERPAGGWWSWPSGSNMGTCNSFENGNFNGSIYTWWIVHSLMLDYQMVDDIFFRWLTRVS